jgi:hypothetical protein
MSTTKWENNCGHGGSKKWKTNTLVCLGDEEIEFFKSIYNNETQTTRTPAKRPRI